MNNGSGNTTIDGSGSGTVIVMTAVTGLEKGALIKNASRATPIGTMQCDEVMEVIGISTLDVTVVRDVERQNGGTGSTAHAANDNFEVIYTPKEEGSSADANKYTDVELVDNYCNTVDFHLNVTGDQAETARLVAGDTLENQFAKCLLKLQNDIEGMFFYGCLNNSSNPGSDAYVARTKGFNQWICQTGGNVDYTTTAVTFDAIDALLQKIVENKTDPQDRFIIACHPQNAATISDFGADKVLIGQDVTVWGRTIDTLKSRLGIRVPVIWTLNCSKSDLFIIDLNKVAMPLFRPFRRATWTFDDDGTDAWRTRYLGSLGVKVVNGLYSHGKLGKISWS
jgi:hypothetical protein